MGECRSGWSCSTQPASWCSSSCSTVSCSSYAVGCCRGNGGTFELSHRLRPGDEPGRGWLLGLGRYSGDELEWFRIFTLAPRPKRSWNRARLSYDGAREPAGLERTVLYPDHLVVECASPQGRGGAGDEPGVPHRVPVLARVAAARDGLVALTQLQSRRGSGPCGPQRRRPGVRAQRLPVRLAGLPDPGPAGRAVAGQRRPGVAAARDRGRLGPGAAVGGRAHPPVERRRGGAVGLRLRRAGPARGGRRVPARWGWCRSVRSACSRSASAPACGTSR